MTIADSRLDPCQNAPDPLVGDRVARIPELVSGVVAGSISVF
jgi:hypothetical protein